MKFGTWERILTYTTFLITIPQLALQHIEQLYFNVSNNRTVGTRTFSPIEFDRAQQWQGPPPPLFILSQLLQLLIPPSILFSTRKAATDREMRPLPFLLPSSISCTTSPEPVTPRRPTERSNGEGDVEHEAIPRQLRNLGLGWYEVC